MLEVMKEEFEKWHRFSVTDDMDIQTEVAWDNWQAAWDACNATIGAEIDCRFAVRLQRRKIQHQRIVVEEIGMVAEARGQFGGEGVDVGRLQQERDQRQGGALDLERGRRASCKGNGHGSGRPVRESGES